MVLACRCARHARSQARPLGYSSPQMATLYDLMLMLDADLPEDRRDELVKTTRKSIESGGGNVVSANTWGTRKLAYEIDHRTEAAYYLFQFEGGNELLAELGRSLGIADGVLRFRIIRQPPGTKPAPPPPLPAAESPRPSTEKAPAAPAEAPAAPAEPPPPAPQPEAQTA